MMSSPRSTLESNARANGARLPWSAPGHHLNLDESHLGPNADEEEVTPASQLDIVLLAIAQIPTIDEITPGGIAFSHYVYIREQK